MIAPEGNPPTTSHQQSAADAPTSDAPSANPTPLTPQEAAARKARMNADLIDAFKSPCPPGTTPYVTGIGLYTHIQGPPGAPVYPDGKPQPQQVFLPVRVPKNSGSQGSQLDELVGKLWEKLEKAIQEEEEIIGKTELGLEELRKRYGGFDAPKNSRPPVQYVQQRQDGKDGRRTDVGNMRASANGRNQSPKGVMASFSVENKVADMRGTEVEQERTQITSSTTAFYGPDPRRQGR